MRSKQINRLEEFGIRRSEATPEAYRALGLVKTEDSSKIREAIGVAGYDVARTIYAFHKYYKDTWTHHQGAQYFDDKFSIFRENEGRRKMPTTHQTKQKKKIKGLERRLTSKLTGERFILDMVRLEQLARAIEGNYTGELIFPHEWKAIEEPYKEITKLWNEKYAPLNKRCQKGVESARKVIVPKEIVAPYNQIMSSEAVKERFEQAPILLMGSL